MWGHDFDERLVDRAFLRVLGDPDGPFGLQQHDGLHLITLEIPPRRQYLPRNIYQAARLVRNPCGEYMSIRRVALKGKNHR